MLYLIIVENEALAACPDEQTARIVAACVRRVGEPEPRIEAATPSHALGELTCRAPYAPTEWARAISTHAAHTPRCDWRMRHGDGVCECEAGQRRITFTRLSPERSS